MPVRISAGQILVHLRRWSGCIAAAGYPLRSIGHFREEPRSRPLAAVWRLISGRHYRCRRKTNSVLLLQRVACSRLLRQKPRIPIVCMWNIFAAVYCVAAIGVYLYVPCSVHCSRCSSCRMCAAVCIAVIPSVRSSVCSGLRDWNRQGLPMHG